MIRKLKVVTDCVDEETACSDARVQGGPGGGRIQQVLSVAGNMSQQQQVCNRRHHRYWRMLSNT